MAAELTEGTTYVVKATTTNFSTKAGVPVAAVLTVNIAAVVDSQTILDDSEVYEFAAEETHTFEFTMGVPIGAGGKAGVVVAEVLDPSGNKLAEGSLDISIAPLGPTIINGGFAGLPPWVFDTNYWGRSGGGVECSASELDKYELLPIEGICVAEMHASVGGRRINMTFTESIPWSDSYRGLPISVSVRAISERYKRDYGVSFYSGTIMRVEIDDGVSVSSSPSIDSGIGAWQRVTANKIIASNATKLDIVLRCLPWTGFPSGFNAFFDNVRME